MLLPASGRVHACLARRRDRSGVRISERVPAGERVMIRQLTQAAVSSRRPRSSSFATGAHGASSHGGLPGRLPVRLRHLIRYRLPTLVRGHPP